MAEQKIKETTQSNKEIHDHLRSISRINTMLAVVSLVVVLGVFAWIKWSYLPAQNTNSNTAAQQQELTSEEKKALESRQTVEAVDAETLAKQYRNSVEEYIGDYAFDDAGAASDLLPKVLDLKVPGALQQVHLDIVLALTDAQKGDYTAAQDRIRSVQSNYAWVTTGVE